MKVYNLVIQYYSPTEHWFKQKFEPKIVSKVFSNVDSAKEYAYKDLINFLTKYTTVSEYNKEIRDHILRYSATKGGVSSEDKVDNLVKSFTEKLSGVNITEDTSDIYSVRINNNNTNGLSLTLEQRFKYEGKDLMYDTNVYFIKGNDSHPMTMPLYLKVTDGINVGVRYAVIEQEIED